MMPNVFEVAARRKFRFASPQGQLTVEQLFDLPLTTTVGTKASLDNVSRLVLADQRDNGQSESLVAVATSRNADIDLKVEIVRQVIAAKQEELAAANERAANRDRKQKILDALDAAEGRELSSKSTAELRAELSALS